MAIQIMEFRKFEKNSLQGFVTLLLTGAGIQIRDATYHQSDGKRWISLPAKPYKDEAGSTRYSYIVSFPDKKIYSKFQEQALKALDEFIRHQSSASPDVSDSEIPF
jgi:hypothetical protein